MGRFFQVAFGAIGFAALIIGLSIFLFGPQAVGAAFSCALAALHGGEAIPPSLGGADIDSEMRFYAVFWFAYGAIVVATARGLDRHAARVLPLLGLFFAGGVGRLLSIAAYGWPHPLFVSLMTIELAAPPLLFVLWRASRR